MNKNIYFSTDALVSSSDPFDEVVNIFARLVLKETVPLIRLIAINAVLAG